MKTVPAPTLPKATFNGVGFEVAFSFDYPATWTVKNTGVPNLEGGPFIVSNEAGKEVASLYVQPLLDVHPCENVCGDMAVEYLGEVPGQGLLSDNSYAVQTMAMDLTSRRDLQNAHRWENNVKLIVGVVGKPSTAPAEDPLYFNPLAGVTVPSTSSPVRPIIFGAYRYFGTMTEAKAYTSSTEHAQIQTMMVSLKAKAVTASATGSSSPATTQAK